MSDTCRHIEEQFVALGREALLNDPEARVHIETCEQCAAFFAPHVDAVSGEIEFGEFGLE